MARNQTTQFSGRVVVENQTLAGLWTLFGTWALAFDGAYFGHGFGPLFSSLRAFFTGNAAELHRHPDAPLKLAALIAAFLVIALPVAFVIAGLVHAGLGDTDNALSSFFSRVEEKYYFRVIFLTVLVEELFARWLFFGIIGHFWTGAIATYVLFVVGNGIWALVHLHNIDDRSKRNPFRVLTQFVTGALLTAIYLHFGFMAVLLAHFAFDALVFSVTKVQKWTRRSFGVIVFYVLMALASYFLLTRVCHDHLSQTGIWFGDDVKFAIPGWGIPSYVLAATLIGSLMEIALELLAFDQDNVAQLREMAGKRQGLIATFLGSAIVIGLSLLVYHALGLIMTNTSHRIIVVALIFVLLLSTSMSGSAMARTFWEGLPLLYVSISCFVALGFWDGVAFVVVRSVLNIPERAVVLWKLDA